MITTVLILLILVSLWMGFYQIVKQQGRILLRLDQIERNAQAARTNPEKPVEEAEPAGLPVETVFPAFSFPDVSGKTVVLEEFRGKRVLLVNWNFQCGFCDSITTELTRLESAFEKHNTQLVLLAHGDAQSNRNEAAKRGLKCRMLLRTDQETAEPFDHEGTPVAYLLDELGRVAAPVARGKDQVLSLAWELAGEKTGVSPSGELRSELGTDFPAFQFPDLRGGMVALGDFRGHRVLLVHWNFDCGFCSTLAPELARFETRLEERNVRLVLLAKGDAESNRERAAALGLTCRILLLQGREKPQPFEHRGTPVAYLLDEEGRIAAPFASGRDEVLSLARQAAGNEAGTPQSEVAESRGIDLSGRPPQAQTRERHRIKLPGFIVRGEIGLGDVIKRVTSAIGIKPCVGCERRAAFLNRWMAFSGSGRGTLQPGKRAPVFRLPDLQGRVVSLEEYQGRRVLLVFSDPHCGPCDELAPHLVRLHREHEKNGLSIILVGHGDADENRHKAVQHGFQFPVVLQKKWKLSKEYGTLATPAAFLIGQNGVIAKDAAVGRDAILALAGGGGG
jgi:peroxiredoxin